MRILFIFALSLLIVCGLMVITEAGCPHCQAIVEVTVELNNGNISHGFFEYHQDDLPSTTAIDGRVILPLGTLPTDFYPKDFIRLLDTVVVIPEFGRFASIDDIDSIAVMDIKQMVLESWLTKSGAERIQFLRAGSIELLSSPKLIRFDTTIDLSVIHYISLNDLVRVGDLQRLARNRILIGPSQDRLLNHLLIRLKYMDGVDDSLFTKHLIMELSRKHTILLTMQEALDSMTRSDIVDQHFAIVSSYIIEWVNFINALLGYLRNDDKQILDNAITNIRQDSGFPDDIDNHPYEINGTVDREGITYLIQSYVKSHKLNLKLGKDYSHQLNAHGIYIFKQSFD